MQRKGREGKTNMQSCKRIKVELKGKSNKRSVKQGKGDGNLGKCNV